MNVAAELLRHGNADAPAIHAGVASFTYRRLREGVERTACVLLAAGLRRQERVGVWAENGVFFATSYLGVILAGLVAVPIQTDSARDGIASMLKGAGASAILASKRHLPMARAVAAALGIPVLSDDEVVTHRQPLNALLPALTDAHDLAALMFTSGSTGSPKGVMVTHGNIASNVRDILSYLDSSQYDRVMAVLPFYYCYGLSLLHTHLAAGASLVINNQFMYPELVLSEMEERECTGFAGVPSTYQILLRKSRFKEARLPSIRWFQQAGGHLSTRYIREISRGTSARSILHDVRTDRGHGATQLPPSRAADRQARFDRKRTSVDTVGGRTRRRLSHPARFGRSRRDCRDWR